MLWPLRRIVEGNAHRDMRRRVLLVSEIRLSGKCTSRMSSSKKVVSIRAIEVCQKGSSFKAILRGFT